MRGGGTGMIRGEKSEGEKGAGSGMTGGRRDTEDGDRERVGGQEGLQMTVGCWRMTRRRRRWGGIGRGGTGRRWVEGEVDKGLQITSVRIAHAD